MLDKERYPLPGVLRHRAAAMAAAAVAAASTAGGPRRVSEEELAAAAARACSMRAGWISSSMRWHSLARWVGGWVPRKKLSLAVLRWLAASAVGMHLPT